MVSLPRMKSREGRPDMVLWKLAWRNLAGAGLRTWLNVLVLGLSFILIIWGKGLVDGMEVQLTDAMKKVELGDAGQAWHIEYDPDDPLTLADAHGKLPEEILEAEKEGTAAPIFITSGSVYPDGRVKSILIKGISTDQKVLDIPSDKLKGYSEDIIPGMIGSRMANSCGLEVGNEIMMRWRDSKGVFDARMVTIVHIFNTVVMSIDKDQVWLPLDLLQELMESPGEATLVALDEPLELPAGTIIWTYKDMDDLLKVVIDLVQTKNAGGNIFYGLIFCIALLAIFDTQVLSIFRRKREMGMLMAMGLTRGRVIRLFTLEGSMHGILAFIAGGILGSPLFYYFAVTGYQMPGGMEDLGLPLGNIIYAKFGAGLLLGTTFLLFITVMIVSFLPTRRISKLTPTDALRGK